jgi:hypothetical protein
VDRSLRADIPGQLADRLGGLEVDDQLVLCWCLHRKVGRFFALEDTIDVARRASVLISWVCPVADETAAELVKL